MSGDKPSEPADVTSDGPSMAADEAEEHLARINAWGAAFPHDDVEALYRGRAWISLGLSSWAELIRERINPFGAALPQHARVVIAGTLRQDGLSTRAIAPVVGVSQSTVVRDLAAASTDSNASVESGERERSASETVLSLDGRRRPATTGYRRPLREQVALQAAVERQMQSGMAEWMAIKQESDALATKLDVIVQLDADCRAEILAELPRVRATLDELERRLMNEGDE